MGTKQLGMGLPLVHGLKIAFEVSTPFKCLDNTIGRATTVKAELKVFCASSYPLAKVLRLRL